MELSFFIMEKETSQCTWDANHDFFPLILLSTITVLLEMSYIRGTCKLWPTVTDAVFRQKSNY